MGSEESIEWRVVKNLGESGNDVFEGKIKISGGIKNHKI
jgi:hypothetical protein